MDKETILNYIAHTPENTNLNIVSNMIDQLGGSSDDFSIAQVTISGVISLAMPRVIDSKEFTGLYSFIEERNFKGDIFLVPLYKGVSIIFITSEIEESDLTLTGNLSYNSEDGVIIVTGDGTITSNSTPTTPPYHEGTL